MKDERYEVPLFIFHLSSFFVTRPDTGGSTHTASSP
jgi:hypothetical protein